MESAVIKEDFPVWALCYLFNGERDTLTDDEVTMIDNWVEKWGESAMFEVASTSDDFDVFFNPFPPFGLACDCTELYIIHANVNN